MKHIAILGGSFDPIHNGHLALAKFILKNKKADEVWFMPTLITPLKDRKLVSYDLRCKMIIAMIKPYRKMKLNRLEETLPTPSYTINTVRVLKKKYPEFKFSWIIGADQANQLDKWKYIDELKQEIRFLCVQRDGNNPIKDECIDVLNGFDHPASSTLVRQGEWRMVSPTVRKIMIDNGLYIDTLLNSRLSEHRRNHSLSMTDVAVKLAKAHQVDEHKAWMAGMLHDISKEVPYEEALKIMRVIHPDKLALSHKIWHQWLAEDYLKTHLGIYDKTIVNAVAHHVLGDGKSKLSKIIFISDKIDPARGYDISKQLKVSLADLNSGLALIRKEQKEHLKKEGVNV